MAKKAKNQDQPNPAILAVAEILPTLSFLDLIETMSYVFQEIKKRHDAE
jgi:hypothetical protein